METPGAPIKVALAGWGRRGPGGQLMWMLASELTGRTDVDLALSYSRSSDVANELRTERFPRLEVDTFEGGAASVLVASPRIVPLVTRTARWLRAHRVDVVTTMIFHPWNVVWGLAARRAGARFVPFVHDIDPHPGDGLPLQRTLTALELRLAHVPLALSEHVAQRIANRAPRFAGRIPVIGLPPLTPAKGSTRTMPAGRPIRLLFLGRLRDYKGLDLLAPMVDELRHRGRDVEMRVAGQGELRVALPQGTELISRWMGTVEMDELLEWTDVLVAPYREASQSGVVPLAAALGVPSLVTPVGGLREQVVDGSDGVIATDVSASALADAFERLATPGTYERCSSGALARANGAWTDATTRLVRVWKSAAGYND